MRSAVGLAFYSVHNAPTEDSSSIAFERHFTPQLKVDSYYFGSVNNLIKCVERNAGKDLST